MSGLPCDQGKPLFPRVGSSWLIPAQSPYLQDNRPLPQNTTSWLAMAIDGYRLHLGQGAFRRGFWVLAITRIKPRVDGQSPHAQHKATPYRVRQGQQAEQESLWPIVQSDYGWKTSVDAHECSGGWTRGDIEVASRKLFVVGESDYAVLTRGQAVGIWIERVG
jgi:hypothetical protein